MDDVAAVVQLAAEGRGQLRRGADEAHSDKDEVGREHRLGAGLLVHLGPVAGRVNPFDLDRLDRFDATSRAHRSLAGRNLADEAARVDEIAARVGAPQSGGLFLTVVHLVDLGPLRPRVVVGAGLGRPGQDLELRDALRALADGRADAVGAGVAAADDDDVLAGGGDGRGRPAEQRLGAGDEEVHGEVDAGQIPTLDSQIARDRGADRENRGVVVLDHLLGRNILANCGAGDELDALGLEELDAAFHDRLVQLHVRDAVHEQAADPIVALEYGHLVAGSVELRGGGQASRPPPANADLLSCGRQRRLGGDPAFEESVLDDLVLDGLDRDRGLADAEGARAFARRRADAPGELWEVVGLVEADDRFSPLAAIDEVVPFRDQVVDRTAHRHAVDKLAGVAVWGPTIHAAGALLTQRLLLVARVGLGPVLGSLEGRPDVSRLAPELHEASRLAHRLIPCHSARVQNVLLERGHLGLVLRETTLAHAGLSLDDAAVVVGNDADEPAHSCTPVVQQRLCPGAAGVFVMTLQETTDLRHFVGIGEREQLDHLLVADSFEAAAGSPAFAAFVEDVGHTAGHASGEVPPGLADDHDLAAGHVLAAVIAYALNHRADPGVANTEALAGDASNVNLAGRGPIERHVGGDDVVLGHELGLARREEDDLAARQALPDVVVGVALEG